MQPRRTLIVGTGDEALLVYRKIKAHPEYGLEIVGFLSAEGEQDEGLPEPVIGIGVRGRRDRRLLRGRQDPDRVLGREPRGDARPAADGAPTRRPRLDRAAVLRDLHVERAIADVEGIPVVELPPPARRGCPRARSATFDLVVSVHGLLVLSPLLARDRASRSSSTREGRRSSARRGAAARDSTFQIFKFRTMLVGAEEMRAEVLDVNEVDGPLFKIGDDPRVTRVGGVPAQDVARRAAAALERAARAR